MVLIDVDGLGAEHGRRAARCFIGVTRRWQGARLGGQVLCRWSSVPMERRSWNQEERHGNSPAAPQAYSGVLACAT